jgi:hypothetical protein
VLEVERLPLLGLNDSAIYNYKLLITEKYIITYINKVSKGKKIQFEITFQKLKKKNYEIK